MGKKTKIAIYSGDIPSTTFVERLIVGLTEKDYSILLFGLKKHKVNYNKNIKVLGYTNGRIKKGFYLIVYSCLLFFFKYKDKKTLDNFLKSNARNSLYEKVKSYPVLWHKPDIFHIQWAKGLEDWLWVKTFGIKLVLSLRGAHINYSPIASVKLATMYREKFPLVDRFHAVSNAIAYEAQKYGAPKEKIKTIYSGLNFTDFDQIELKKEAHTLEIISVGRSHWVKGYTYALDACKLLKDKGFKFKYTIVGGKGDIELAYQIYDRQLNDDVILLDRMPFNKVQMLIQASDLLLLTSLKEGLANVVLEAMALKTMVLTTDCGGMNEVIINRENGFIIPIRNSEKMAETILEINTMSNEMKSNIVNNAFKTVKEKHSKAQMLIEMQSLYDSVL